MLVLIERKGNIQHVAGQQLRFCYSFRQPPSHSIVHKRTPPTIRRPIDQCRGQLHANMFFPDGLHRSR